MMLTVSVLSSCGLITVVDISDKESDINGSDPYDYEAYDFSEYELVERDISYRSYEDFRNILPEYDYKGDLFFIAREISQSYEDEPDCVKRYEYIRDSVLESALNVKLKYGDYTSESLFESIKKSNKSETMYANALFLKSESIYKYREENLLYDLSLSEAFEPDCEYFNYSSFLALSGGQAAFAISGLSTIVPSDIPVVFLPVASLEKSGYSFDDISDVVLNGKWTWDLFLQILDAAETGFISDYDRDTLIDKIFISNGNYYTLTKDRRAPILGYKKASFSSQVDLFRDVMGICEYKPGDISGKAAIAPLSALSDTDGYIFLPLPKYEEKDSYRSLMGSDALVQAIPSKGTDTGQSFIMMLHHNAASAEHVFLNYKDELFRNYSYGYGQDKIIDKIFSSPYFDFSIAYGNEYRKLKEATHDVIALSLVSDKWADNYSGLMRSAYEEIKFRFTENNKPETEKETETDTEETTEIKS